MLADGQEANVGSSPDNTNPPTDDQISGGEVDWRARAESLESQLKGHQRTTERLRAELKERENLTAMRQETELYGSAVEKLYGVLSKSRLLDDDAVSELRDTLNKTTTRRDEIGRETTARTAIVDIAAETGIDWDSDEAEGARAYYEAGKFDEAVKSLQRVAKKKQDETVDKLADEKLQEKLRETGRKVDTGTSTGSSLRTDREKIVEALATKNYDPHEVYRQAVAAAQKRD